MIIEWEAKMADYLSIFVRIVDKKKKVEWRKVHRQTEKEIHMRQEIQNRGDRKI